MVKKLIKYLFVYSSKHLIYGQNWQRLGNEKRVPYVGTLLIRYYLKICSATESTGKPMDVVVSLFAASTMPSAMM